MSSPSSLPVASHHSSKSTCLSHLTTPPLCLVPACSEVITSFCVEDVVMADWGTKILTRILPIHVLAVAWFLLSIPHEIKMRNSVPPIFFLLLSVSGISFRKGLRAWRSLFFYCWCAFSYAEIMPGWSCNCCCISRSSFRSLDFLNEPLSIFILTTETAVDTKTYCSTLKDIFIYFQFP